MINFEEKIARAEGKLSYISTESLKNVDLLEKLRERQEALIPAQAFLQKIAQDTQNQLRFCVKDIVQLALDTCFPGEYKFDLVFEIKRGKTEAKLLFLSGGEEINPMDASGGGVVDIASFALRISQWVLGNTRNTIILDEPFKHLSNNLQPAGAEVLRELSDKLGLQFIIVTHREEITETADKVFKVTREKEEGWKKSVVKEIL